VYGRSESGEAMTVVLTFRDARVGDVDAGADQLVVIGTKSALSRADLVALLPESVKPVWPSMVASMNPGDQFAATSTWVAKAGVSPDADAVAAETDGGTSNGAMRVQAIAVSDRASRHNASCRPDAVASSLRGRFAKGAGRLILALSRASDLSALAGAVGRAFPLYLHKGKKADDVAVEVLVVSPEPLAESSIARAQGLCDAVRDAGRLTDMPPSELHTDAFVDEVTSWCSEHGLTPTILRAHALRERGFGGLVGVGQAATREPALVHVRWDPPVGTGSMVSTGSTLQPMAWVGKGIVFDTGGLSMKGKSDMPGMKVDMGGAAAVWSAFKLAVAMKVPRRIDAILCLAENSVGPLSMRPDDIITLYSGKTVEVNNTDAEGRLVLADGVAYALRDCGASIVIDLATLTGAQLMATGKVHAAIISNDDALEDAAVAAGQVSGDLCFPLPYAPEFFRAEFSSPVADLRNSVKDRMNAQSSCAAQFIAESLTATTPDGANVRWLHVDMAGPAVSRDRGTGFGVGLLLALTEAVTAASAPTSQGV